MGSKHAVLITWQRSALYKSHSLCVIPAKAGIQTEKNQLSSLAFSISKSCQASAFSEGDPIRYSG